MILPATTKDRYSFFEGWYGMLLSKERVVVAQLLLRKLGVPTLCSESTQFHLSSSLFLGTGRRTLISSRGTGTVFVCSQRSLNGGTELLSLKSANSTTLFFLYGVLAGGYFLTDSQLGAKRFPLSLSESTSVVSDQMGSVR